MALEEADRILVVADLRPRIQMLTIVAVADAEIAIVEDESIETGGDECLGIGRHDDFTHIAPAAGEDDGRSPLAFLADIKPAAAGRAVRFEFNVASRAHV